MKKCLTMWQIWALLAGVFGLLLIFRNNDLSGVLPFAIFLICPLMMIFMMKDHHKH